MLFMNSTSHTKKIGGLFVFIVCALFMSFLLINVSLAQAQTPDKYTLLEALPCIESPETVDGNGNKIPAVTCSESQIREIDFQGYVQYMFNLLIALAAVAAVFMIVWGGFEYMSSDSFLGKKDGLKKLQNAISGLLLVLCSYLILKTIDPRLVAIPTNLVEPIIIQCADNPDISIGDPGCKSGDIGSFFNELTAELEKYQVKIQGIAEKQKQTQAIVSDLKKQQDALLAQLHNYKIGDPEFDELVAEIKNKDYEIAKEKANLVVNATKLSLAAQSKQTFIDLENNDTTKNLSGINMVFDKQKEVINKIRDDGNSQLTKINQLEEIYNHGGINDQANYYESVLELNRSDTIVGNTTFGLFSKNTAYVGSSAVFLGSGEVFEKKELESRLAKYIGTAEQMMGNVKDPELQKDLQKRLKNSRDLINAKFSVRENNK
ncbi:MAG: hypothetical protein A2830_00645 [Candidatus Taylorbacteria bacterium RIFCSPHIGHO2_01_FULL_44_110]|nr:MAG: hypothetical protein A2830_00645 [Candidatus Taylorbacteria bacterium RIFCSPHIGHO2_01_FULL_44_110]